VNMRVRNMWVRRVHQRNLRELLGPTFFLRFGIINNLLHIKGVTCSGDVVDGGLEVLLDCMKCIIILRNSCTLRFMELFKDEMDDSKPLMSSMVATSFESLTSFSFPILS
jgi:hypothetical protein